MTFSNWAQYEPDNSGTCVKMNRQQKWEDIPCARKYPFVCQLTQGRQNADRRKMFVNVSNFFDVCYNSRRGYLLTYLLMPIAPSGAQAFNDPPPSPYPPPPRHRILFWAALVIPDQLVPCCFSSASVSRLQLLRGRPLFLFPCGFQARAWRVVLDAGFLRVCRG